MRSDALHHIRYKRGAGKVKCGTKYPEAYLQSKQRVSKLKDLRRAY